MGTNRKPLGYLVTFTCYGMRLHGSSRGSVDRLHNRPGSSFAEPDHGLDELEALRMGQPYFKLDRKRAEIAFRATDMDLRRKFNRTAKPRFHLPSGLIDDNIPPMMGVNGYTYLGGTAHGKSIGLAKGPRSSRGSC